MTYFTIRASFFLTFLFFLADIERNLYKRPRGKGGPLTRTCSGRRSSRRKKILMVVLLVLLLLLLLLEQLVVATKKQ